jgi:CDGSH-type Zn-finger protein/uncharacterized Fe-S cluster protein YjdI
MSMTESPQTGIRITSREDVLYLLAEATAIEHNLMCCYLYAAFSLKRSAEEGLNPNEAAMTNRWYGLIISVAIEEMAHLSLVANLVCALGGRPNFDRPNFPVAAGYHPDDVVLRLAPFTMDTLEHFIFLERPQGSEVTDGASFCGRSAYKRVAGARRVMPSSQDFLTVGQLYVGIREGLDSLAKSLGERQLFCSSVAHQISPAVVSLPGLCVVTDLKSAQAAIDTIVNQGEGAPQHRGDSHFSKFQSIQKEFLQALASNPNFVPGRPVADCPVMRKPPSDALNRVFIEEPLAALTVDLANAIYGQMLRFLVQAFGRSAPQVADQTALIDAAIATMQCLVPVADALTRLPATASKPGVTAGMTFGMLRNLSPAIEGSSEWHIMVARVAELKQAAGEIGRLIPTLAGIEGALQVLGEQLAARAASGGVPAAAISHSVPAAPAVSTAPDNAIAASLSSPEIEVADSPGVTIKFEAKRCIHSRFCVLWQPQVYKANVPGPWLNPAADSVEAVVAVAHNCPSGAIQYERHDGQPQERAPAVNLINIRENGPLAFRATICLSQQLIGYRATLCRCGASKNKPFCDNSHRDTGFTATGEPATIDTPVLAARGGPLEIEPKPNGPLRVRGSMEICSGTGRTVKRSSSEALCRCGRSANKPFCDGTHARVGFIAP